MTESLYPVDSEGTVFDPAIHNLLDKPARPELSSLGKFVKVRGNDGNDQELIDRFHELLEDQAKSLEDSAEKLIAEINEKALAVVPPAADVSKINKKLLTEVAHMLRCEVLAIEGDVAILKTIGRVDNITGAARLGKDLGESLDNFRSVGVY